MQSLDLVEHRPTADGCLIVIRRRGRAEESRVVARNFQVISALQTEEVEGRLAARLGGYDGRKNLFTPFKIGTQIDVHEASQSYRRSSPQLNIFPAFQSSAALRKRREKSGQRRFQLTAAMVCAFLAYLNRLVLRYFFTDQETRTIPGGVVPWRGYFQSVRPAIK